MVAQPSANAGRAHKPSLEEVFRAEQSPLLRYAFGLVGRREVAEELVQDAFLRLPQHWKEVEQPRAWLFRCVRNGAYNHLRDHKREALTDPAAPDAYAASSPDQKQDRGQEAPDEVLGRLEAAGILHVLMGDLEDRDREMLRLKYVEGLTYSEINERIDLSAGNVGWKLHYVLENLADSLRRVGVEGGWG